MKETQNEYEKYQNIRYIANQVAIGIATPEKVELATNQLMDFAAAIVTCSKEGKSMINIVALRNIKGEIQDVRKDIKLLESSIKHFEGNIDLKFDLQHKRIIIWLGGLMFVGFTSLITVLMKYLPVITKLAQGIK
jgi:hypothetical protein